MPVTVTDRDNGYKKMIDGLDKLGQLAITLGIHAEEGAADDNGQSVIDIAEANEFGIGVPARPFISSFADEVGAEIVEAMRDEAAAALQAGASPAQRLDILAQRYAGEIQANIAAGIDPPNAESTVRKKGSSTPLIDTGIMRSSIRGKVGK